MGAMNLIKYVAKWTITSIIVGWITYANHDSISRTVNNARYYFSDNEEGFVDKNHAFDLRFSYERNGKGNLETYIQNYTSKLPVYMRENGILVGSAEYNFSNFIGDERKKVCSLDLEDKIS